MAASRHQPLPPPKNIQQTVILSEAKNLAQPAFVGRQAISPKVILLNSSDTSVFFLKKIYFNDEKNRCAYISSLKISFACA